MTLTTNQYVRIFAGAFVMISLALGAEASPLFVSKHFLWFTAFVGLNLIQASVTGFCPAAIIFKKAGIRSGCAFQ